MVGRAAVLLGERRPYVQRFWKAEGWKAGATTPNNDKGLEDNPGISPTSELQPNSCADLGGCEAGSSTRTEGQALAATFWGLAAGCTWLGVTPTQGAQAGFRNTSGALCHSADLAYIWLMQLRKKRTIL